MFKKLFVAIFCIGCISCDNSTQTAHEIEVELHDWECTYIIHDGYSQKVHSHYVNGYIRNIDNSISFTDEDGSVWHIPYPYYTIEVNPSVKQCK